MKELSSGDAAPAFDLPADDGTRVTLAGFADRPAVLFFYPKDDTESCTAEALAFSALAPAFGRPGVFVLGISPDSLASHEKFRAKHQLSVRLASDERREAIQAYGVWDRKTMFGRQYMGVVRSTFLLAADAKIERVWRRVKVRGHAEEVLDAALRLAR